MPTLDEFGALGDKGLKTHLVFIDFEKDEKFYRPRQLTIKLVAKLKSNLAKAIKKKNQTFSLLQQPRFETHPLQDCPHLLQFRCFFCK